MRTTAAAFGAAALVLGVAPLAANAAPAGPTCGQVISTNLTLTKNLNCGSGLALEVDGGPAIVIDLAGHTITGTIHLMDAETTIQNGKLVGAIKNGILGASTFTKLTFDGGGLFGDNDFWTITNNKFINGAGISDTQSADDIENNTFVSGPFNAAAINLDSVFSTVINNTITGYGIGIAITGDASSADVQSNHVSSVRGDGITIGDLGGAARVPGNVTNNVSSNNAGDGIVLLDGAGIGIGRRPPELAVTGNTTNNNTYDGIHVDASPAVGFPSGLDVKLTTNHANANGNLGLDSPGSSVSSDGVIVTVVDGGGNTAKGNGHKIQCRNVVCAKV